MKISINLFIAMLLFSLITKGQTQNEKIIITGSRFTYPLINKWIEEFKKTNPEVGFHLIPRGTPNVDSANFIINAHELKPEEIKQGFKVVNISRYVLLPIANERNPLLKKYSEKGIDEKELKELFFQKFDPLAGIEKPQKEKGKNEYKPTLYTREQRACAPITFAANFGFEQQDILGKSIGGDDNHLLLAVKKDTNGITYNNLGFIYDVKTRQVQKGIQVIPLDLNGNNKLDKEEQIYTSLDQVIEHSEKKKDSPITLGYVNISYPADHKEKNKNLTLFLNWVLTEGQQFNHEYGFLNLEEEILSKQKEILLSSIK